MFNTVHVTRSETKMTENNTRNNTRNREKPHTSCKTITLDPKDAWHEVECPYCGKKNGITETNNTPDRYGTCSHCKNTVKLINTIDSQ